MEPMFFETPQALADGSTSHHVGRGGAWIGFWKTGSGRPSATWPQGVDQARALGWIDRVRHSIDSERYKIRFTPRGIKSVWSRVNVARVAPPKAAEAIAGAGQRVFGAGARPPELHSYEGQPCYFAADELGRLQGAGAAWTSFERRPNSHRRPATWWVISAKGAETRERRLARLIEAPAAGRRIGGKRQDP
jgi:uncharacterized protein YdeI (YjbR/CyaY-like superfamily)